METAFRNHGLEAFRQIELQRLGGEDLGTREREQLALRDMGWGNFADEVEVRRVEGDHVGMLSAVNAPTVAQAITEVLACYGGSVVEA